jgi:hypothetical protein
MTLEGIWKGHRLNPGDPIVCADEKPSIQARRHSVQPPAPGRAWLSQVEIHFGVVQRRVLTPAAAHNLPELSHRILTFEARARERPRPMRWNFTRADFRQRCADLAA